MLGYAKIALSFPAYPIAPPSIVMIQPPRALTYQGIPIWRHAQIIEWAAQVASGIVVITLVIWFFTNIGNAVQDRDIPYGFSFLSREYQTPIGDTFIPYESSDTFLYAFGVAALNTVVVAVVGVILATLLGIVIGVARLSGNWIVSRLALIYVEFFRNVPLLVQLLFWFYIILALPVERESYVIAGQLYINNAGISMAWPVPTGFWPALIWLAVAATSVGIGALAHRRLTRREIETGRASYPLLSGCAIVALTGAVAWLVISGVSGDAPFVISTPEPQGRFARVSGGFTARAGMLVLLTGLVMYTASFIAEIVRAGIQSVGRGQTEAARALGLSPMNALRQVIFPQALRVIIPPWISQSLNLTKNSSLGLAVGFTELTSVAQTMTQTAPAISIFMVLMAAYLAMSLTWSLIGNLYNRHIRFS